MARSSSPPQPVLLADIGGTNARFACFDLANQQFLGQHTLPVADYPTIHSALEAAMEGMPALKQAGAACIAIAGPVDEDWIAVSNSPWAFSRRELQARFRWPSLNVINDFLAAALGVLHLPADMYRPIGKSSHFHHRALPSAVLGPGTGLGVAALIPEQGAWRGLATEGGHARFAPVDEEEIALLEVLYRRLGPVQREDILSGRGLVNLYGAWMQVHGRRLAEVHDPAQITALALRDFSSPAGQVLSRFCAILGTVAADVALDLGTRGTVFLAGGILPRVGDFLAASPFRERFENHQQFRGYLGSVDTVLVMERDLGLIGAAYCLQRIR